MTTTLAYNDHDLIALLGSRIRAQEVLFVLEEIKPVCRIELAPQQLALAQRFFKEANLAHLSSTITAPEQNDEADATIPAPYVGMMLVYISKNHSLAQEARIAETHFDHQRLGTLLGYPQCCTRFFADSLSEAQQLHHDHTLIAARGSSTFNPLLNISLQFFDWRIIGHYPCHFNCAASTEQAQQMLRAIGKYNDELSEAIVNHLRALVLYDDETGVHVFEGVGKRGNDYMYKNVLLTSPNPTHELLAKGDTIKKVSNNHVEVHAGKEMIGEIKGQTCALLDFLG
ncbi:hypothetical protein HZB03_03745 [Candidatus Woesearchaeota archaeon]|nr:hypothetical protein [Candidatus Woesearchaeota archaeon]